MSGYTTRCIIPLFLAGNIAVGQQKPSSKAEMRTVCEVLADVTQYADRPLIVVGRMEMSAGIIDHDEFLSEDHWTKPRLEAPHDPRGAIERLWARTGWSALTLAIEK